MTTDRLNNILNTFKTHCNAPDLHAETLVFLGEVLIASWGHRRLGTRMV
jgi:hypothetical protein